MKDLSHISVVLPSLDPDEKLHAVIEGLLEYGFTDIILVNDGSKPENLHYFEDEVAAHPDVIHLLHHEVNKGKGAALKNAFNWFLQNRPKAAGVVTVDGDNQHHPEDTRACCEKMLETGKIVLGCRDFTLDHVPPRSRFGNQMTSGIFKIFVGMTISDTQTGLRAIPKKELKLINTVKGDRFEYETNMLLAMKQNAIPFDVLEKDPPLEELEKYLIPTDSVLPFETLTLTEAELGKILQGQRVKTSVADGLYKIYTADGFYGLAEVLEGLAKAKTKLC